MNLLKKLKSYKFRVKDTYPYRKYFDKYQCIFIHIPKTAGTSLLKATYAYLSDGGNQAQDLYFKELFEKEHMTFEKFVLEYLNEYTIHEHILFKPQYLFVYDYQHSLKVDFVARFERLEEDYVSIRSRIGVVADGLETYNMSARDKNTESYFTHKAMVEKVVRLYRKDFELFGYGDDILFKKYFQREFR